MNGFFSSIPVTYTLTDEQWKYVHADLHISNTYRSTLKTVNALQCALLARIHDLCEQRQLPLPKEIVITCNLNTPIKIKKSGELHIHPLSLLTCELDTDSMTSQQQAIYQRLNDYVKELGSLVSQYSPNNKHSIKELFFKKNLFANPVHLNNIQQRIYRYADLVDGLRDYKYVLPKEDFDELIAMSLTRYKAAGFPKISSTTIKIVGGISAILSGVMAIHKAGLNNLGVFLALSSAYFSYKGLRIMEKLCRVTTLAWSQKEMINPWETLSKPQQRVWCQMELLKLQTTPRLSS